MLAQVYFFDQIWAFPGSGKTSPPIMLSNTELLLRPSWILQTVFFNIPGNKYLIVVLEMADYDEPISDEEKVN